MTKPSYIAGRLAAAFAATLFIIGSASPSHAKSETLCDGFRNWVAEYNRTLPVKVERRVEMLHVGVDCHSKVLSSKRRFLGPATSWGWTKIKIKQFRHTWHHCNEKSPTHHGWTVVDNIVSRNNRPLAKLQTAPGNCQSTMCNWPLISSFFECSSS